MLNQYITLESTSHNTHRYTVDVRAAACVGFSSWYEEAATFAEQAAITFVKEGVVVGYAEYNNR